MTARAPSHVLDWEIASPATKTDARTRDASRTLAALAPGMAGAVVAVALEDELLRWLAAIGIGRGDRVTVLRRAVFGGPIHLRTHTGGEFAVDRGLARCIHVEPTSAEEKKGAA